MSHLALGEPDALAAETVIAPEQPARRVTVPVNGQQGLMFKRNSVLVGGWIVRATGRIERGRMVDTHKIQSPLFARLAKLRIQGVSRGGRPLLEAVRGKRANWVRQRLKQGRNHFQRVAAYDRQPAPRAQR